MNAILSPLTLSKNIELIRSISIADITASYAKMGIRIDRLVDGVSEIQMYRCNDSGLEFFSPSIISGDGRFYAELQKKSWYYMTEKWEYEVTLPLLHEGMAILELGSGSGAFLEKLKRRNIKAVGLELNSAAAAQATKAGLEVRCEDIQHHAQDASESYDCVCSFQVMEHVSAPRAVIESSIRCLRRGGILIMAVPNNSGFIQADNAPSLNMPPHHMLRWNDQALRFLPTLFPISLDSIIHETLQPQHYQYFIDILAQGSGLNESFFKRQIYKMIRRELATGVPAVAPAIVGHTVVAVYRKR